MINQRLRQLRLARGMTLDDLAQATNRIVTRQAISKYEHGQAQPSPIVLQRLAQALGVRPTDLLDSTNTQIELIAYRKRATLSKRYHDHITALATEQLRARLRLQRLIGEPIRLDVPIYGYPIDQLEAAEAAADDLRVRWDLGKTPLVNLTDTLEDHGLHVIALDADNGFDGVAAIARDEHGEPLAAAVIGRRSRDGARWRMNLAHELGHLVLQPTSQLDEEKAAFRFASAFLAPATTLRTHVGEHRHHLHLGELLLLKRHFGMSIQALLYRMQTLGIINQRLYRSWMVKIGEQGWRTNEPEPLPMEEPLWLRRTVLRAVAEELIDPTEAQALLGESIDLLAESSRQDSLCHRLLRQPLAERHAVLAAQAAQMVDLYQTSPNVANEVEASEHSQ
ncbi:helix-turn-helix domain-containing protein [Chloroflexus aggregans]|uniref:Helix-turn-helix domain protein n=1 Tax=Chloroflexus aggregans (strain MD-66 / DSM 9485) TaxID=326427 RepID=B8G5E7_CHLAD|nr:XRE family transcriptional regulator [Chloroflexus aggregans]ACL25653.1 helix-turn-helix domain protein [Chloroflexus aggregans DSM 9485]